MGDGAGCSVSQMYLIYTLKKWLWAGKMAQWVKSLAAKPDDLSSTPTTHMVDGLP